jgi:hypothetical protein
MKMTETKLALRLRLAIVGLMAFALTAEASQWTYDDVERVVAISDIHGAYDAMVSTMQEAGILSGDLTWAGGAAHLVIVGDIVDRGPSSRQVMDILMRLEEEAAAAGGMVHVLVGNHEVMNLVADMRYVSKEEYAAFAADETDAQRERWYGAWADSRSDGGTDEEIRVKFDEGFPDGYFAHREAFGSDGRYGSWLLKKPLLVVINGTAFVHGGLSPMIAELGLEGVNGKLHGELSQYVRDLELLVDAQVLLPTDGFYDHPRVIRSFSNSLTTDKQLIDAITSLAALNESDLHAGDGPLWYRGNVACNALVELDRLEPSLRAIGAHRVVIGHTPTSGRQVLQRFGGRVIEIDTGMLNSYYNGRGSALIIEGDELGVVDQDGLAMAGPAPHPREVGRRSPGLDQEGIERLLETGKVVADREDSAGRRIVSISDGERLVDAVFDKRAGRGFYPEVAAYRLDLLLELDLVPVAVKRELDGVDGSLRFFPADTTDETRRRESGRGGSAYCPLPPQWEAMIVFDALILNEGRVTTSIRYDRSSWQLILTDHSAAFGTGTDRPRHLRDVRLNVGEAWERALRALTEERLDEALGDVLDGRRMRALRVRRDDLLIKTP